jgi:DNA repair exonuclease SbcCD ATPase subunit
MKWSNCFSYGKNNEIELDKSPLTQLVGANGSGKTSISLMIQEVLYGKNSKNIKKQDITNNKSGKKGYSICLFFEKDNDDYSVHLKRNSNLKFKLYKNGEDISSHTSLNTYKTLANIIGIDDFKVFCQLIYQHSTDSLEFLTATDTNRKKFLINLLQLEKYIELHEHFKDKVKVLNSDILSLTGGINTIEAWIKNNENMDFVKKELKEVPRVDKTIIEKIVELEKNITNINSINKKVIANNDYKKKLASLDEKYYLNNAPNKPEKSSNEIKNKVTVAEHDARNIQSKILKLEGAKGRCPECMQQVDEYLRSDMVKEETKRLNQAINLVTKLQEEQYNTLEIEKEIRKYEKAKSEFIKLNQLIDNTLPAQTLDKNELMTEVQKLKRELKTSEDLAKSIEAENLKISAHNSKVDVVSEQLKKMRKDLRQKEIKLVEKENLQNILELLKKTFGTNGLVSYKIESSVKELEKKINVYLSELTHFQIYFKLAGEKLNIEIHDDIGNIFSISNLSSGERARVNVATLLAIRSLLSNLTTTKINFLMLDEVVNTLDEVGREKLAEILLKENLNTFIVSHGWEHPLIDKLYIRKKHHISRIEK